jgi:hypothetical protein
MVGYHKKTLGRSSREHVGGGVGGGVFEHDGVFKLTTTKKSKISYLVDRLKNHSTYVVRVPRVV